MDIVFITPTDRPGFSQEVNGTMLLATKLLQENYSVDIVRLYQCENFNKDYALFLKEIVEIILSKNPRIVSFYTLWPVFHMILRIAKIIKTEAPQIHIVFGGPLVSLYPMDVMERIPWVDYLCTGEGENTIVPFVDAVLNDRDMSQIPGLYRRINGEIVFNRDHPPLCDLNDLPQWDERLFVDDPQNEHGFNSGDYYMPIDVGRGCPFNCTFCCTSRTWKRKYRLKSSDKIVEAIRYHYDKYGIRRFLFSHDAFTVNSRLVEEVCDKILLSGLDIEWNCATRINCLSEDLISKMKASGLRRIQLGVETGSPRMQKLINKNLNLDMVKDTVRYLINHDIEVSLFFMYGFPEEQEQDLEQTLELMFSLLDMGVDRCSMSYCLFSPAAKITEDYFDELVFDNETAVSTRCTFGYYEELDIIKENKRLFPFYYHLNTPLRNNYMFMNCLLELYQIVPEASRIVRHAHRGDNLQMYRNMVLYNKGSFDQDINYALTDMRKAPYDFLIHTLDGLSCPNVVQIKELIRYLKDLHMLSKTKGDCSITKTYRFNYLDYKKKRELTDYIDAETVLMMRKDGRSVTSQILDVKAF